jgi:hypothetical protein
MMNKEVDDNNVQAELVGDGEHESLVQHVAGNTPCAGEGCQNCADISNKVAAFEQENRKEIIITVISDQTRNKLIEVLDALGQLQQEVILKQMQAVEKNKQIKARVQVLMESGKVQIDQEEFNRSEVSVLRYAEVLNQIIVEVEQERVFAHKLLSQEPGSVIQGWKRDPDDFEPYAQARVKFIKQYIKTVKKNLFISFSRYCFGFDAQEQRIGYIESLVRNANMAQAKEKQVAQ